MTDLRRGWCPGLITPMPTGDGLLVRLRLGGVRMPPELALIAANASERYGNGLIDVSARCTLQLRGFRPDGLAQLGSALKAFDLVDPDTAAESARNIVASPASDLDPAALIDAAALSEDLRTLVLRATRKGKLSPKFGILIDDGGAFPLDVVYADIRLRACRRDGVVLLALAIAGRDDTATRIGLFSADEALRATDRLLGAARATFTEHRPRAAECRSWLEKAGMTSIGYGDLPDRSAAPPDLADAVLLSPAFGRLHARELREIANRVPSGATLRLTPWRSLLVGPVTAPVGEDLDRLARSSGFIVERDDPLRFVSACVGMQGCANATTDVRRDARLAAGMLRHQLHERAELHVSGCAKGCARSSKATMTLTGENGRYRVGFDAIAGEGLEILARDDAFDRLLQRSRLN